MQYYSRSAATGASFAAAGLKGPRENDASFQKRNETREGSAQRERERELVLVAPLFEMKRIPTIFMAFHDGRLGIIYHFKLEYGKFSSILQHANAMIRSFSPPSVCRFDQIQYHYHHQSPSGLSDLIIENA